MDSCRVGRRRSARSITGKALALRCRRGRVWNAFCSVSRPVWSEGRVLVQADPCIRFRIGLAWLGQPPSDTPTLGCVPPTPQDSPIHTAAITGGRSARVAFPFMWPQQTMMLMRPYPGNSRVGTLAAAINRTATTTWLSMAVKVRDLDFKVVGRFVRSTAFEPCAALCSRLHVCIL